MTVTIKSLKEIFAASFSLFTVLHCSSIIGLAILSYLLIFTKYYWLTLLYCVYYYLDYDRDEKGAYYCLFLKRLPIWRHLRDYFPVKLIKTVDLPADRNYIFVVAPHGVIPFGTSTNFITDATGFSKLFPGLILHAMTLKANFYFPLTREYNMLYGMCVASRRCFKMILNNEGNWKAKGQVCYMIPGGSEESMISHPGDYNLVLKKRKGFVRIALETGATLVPVFSFGENDIYSTYLPKNGSLLQKFQQFFKRLTTVGFPIVWGYGIIFPYKRPITTVVGNPIHVEKCEQPTNEQVDELHKHFISELVKLFETYKVTIPTEKHKKLILL